eukprot:266408_1
MSSLSAVRADGFYHPPDWDPSKISRDKFQGSKGANQYQQYGVIRFEMPFNFICSGTAIAKEHNIGAGTRYNSKKEQKGSYFSTKIWEFTMKCADCKNPIVIRTDPEHRAYRVMSGGRVKVETWDPKSSETIEIPSEEIRIKRKMDKMFDLERDVEQKTESEKRYREVKHLLEFNDAMKDDFSRSQHLRKKFRTKKKQLAVELSEAKSKGFSQRLLPRSASDSDSASRTKFRNPSKYRQHQKLRRAAIRSASIFGHAPSAVQKSKFGAEKSRIRRNIKVDSPSVSHVDSSASPCISRRSMSACSRISRAGSSASPCVASAVSSASHSPHVSSASSCVSRADSSVSPFSSRHNSSASASPVISSFSTFPRPKKRKRKKNRSITLSKTSSRDSHKNIKPKKIRKTDDQTSVLSSLCDYDSPDSGTAD